MAGFPVLVNGRFLTQRMTGVQRHALEITRQLVSHFPHLEVCTPAREEVRLHDDYHGAIAAAHWVAGQLKEGDTMYEPNFFPAYFAGLEDRKTPAVLPMESAAANHYLILRSRDVEKNPALKKLVETRRAVKVKDFPRKPEGEKRDVHVYLFRGRRP